MKLRSNFNILSVSMIFLYGSAIIDKSQSFIFPSRFDVLPNLSDLAESQTGTLLSIGLDVQNPKSLSRLYIDGLQLELQYTSPNDVLQSIPLPGAHGDHPQFSTGPLNLDTKSVGNFVSMKGKQILDVQNGVWEMIWVDGRPNGSIVCGFELPEPCIRNDAVLPSGKIYLSFRVWTPKGLHDARNHRMKYERNLAENMKTQKDALEKMHSTHNPIMKVKHFRDATAANEKVYVSYTKEFDFIPLEDEEIVEVGDGLWVAKEGSIWTVRERRTFLGKKNTNIFIGRALLK